jgi:hypothetical protein
MTKQNVFLWSVVALGLAGAAAACSETESKKPTNINVGGEDSGGASSGGASSRGGSTSKGGTTSVGGDTGQGGSSASAGASNGSAGTDSTAGGSSTTAGAGSLAGAAGQGADCQDTVKKCFKCAPTNSLQLLNHCTDATCVYFDNKTLTKLNADGSRPPLP